MNRSSRAVAAAGAVALAFAAFAPAHAQYANEFVPAKRLTAGTASAPVAGTGIVIVQVQVNADGSHKVTKIIRSTNSGNNEAATQIANSATYRPAHRGKTAVVSFYDYTLKFTGRTVAAQSDTGALGQIRGLIRSSNYSVAKTKAAAYVLANPGDPVGRTLLGLADYYAGDMPGSAAAFAAVSPIDKRYAAVAAHAFAAAVMSTVNTNPNLALSYAQKAYALDKGPNALFALGVAQLGANQAAAAIPNLKAARDAAFADKTTGLQSKINLDSALMQAYAKSGDLDKATVVGNEIRQLDPTSTAPQRVLGNLALNAAFAALTAKQYDLAVTNFDKAADVGDSLVKVTAYAQAALALTSVAKPDYTKVKTYADKALAVKVDDPLANYAEAVALTGIWAQVSHKDSDKTAAKDYAAKGAQYARAAGNEALALQIESFVKTNLK